MANYAVNTVPTFSAIRRQPVAKKSVDVRRRYIKQVLTLFSVVIIMSLMFVWVRVKVIQLGYEVTKIQKEVKDLTVQKNRLEADIASLHQPQRLEKIAVETFGMRPPLGDEVVLVETGKGN
jgi:cell division protein FtsL